MQGASALEKILKKEVDPKIRVFVIWERVRFFDFGAPSTFTLRRIADVRASQYWDKERLVSHILGENDSSPVVWDYVAVYPKGTLWDQIPPKPIYFHVPVISGKEGLSDAIRPLLRAAAKRNLTLSLGRPQTSEEGLERNSSDGTCTYEKRLRHRTPSAQAIPVSTKRHTAKNSDFLDYACFASGTITRTTPGTITGLLHFKLRMRLAATGECS